MSAYRQAMLSVPPERVEQFSMEIKQDISDSKKQKRKSSSSRGHDRHKAKKQSRSSNKKSKKKSSDSKKSSGGRSKSDQKRRKEGKQSRAKRDESDNDDEKLTGDSDVEEGGVDLDGELHPLSYYVKDRKVLMEQVFKIVQAPKLAAMLPDILKNMPVDELKRKCLAQLEVMSSKRILHILSGETMVSSSGTDSSDNEAEAKNSSANKRASQKRETPSLQTNFIDSTTPSSFEVLSLLADGAEKSAPPTSQPRQAVVSSGPQGPDPCVEPRPASSALGSADRQPAVPDRIPPVTGSTSHSGSEGESSAHEEGEVVSDDEAVEVEVEELDLVQASTGASGPASEDDEEVETVEIVEDAEYEEMVDTILEETLPSSQQEKPAAENEGAGPEDQPRPNLSQLELLELQLRERAIKSLMKAAGKMTENTAAE